MSKVRGLLKYLKVTIIAVMASLFYHLFVSISIASGDLCPVRVPIPFNMSTLILMIKSAYSVYEVYEIVRRRLRIGSVAAAIATIYLALLPYLLAASGVIYGSIRGAPFYKLAELYLLAVLVLEILLSPVIALIIRCDEVKRATEKKLREDSIPLDIYASMSEEDDHSKIRKKLRWIKLMLGFQRFVAKSECYILLIVSILVLLALGIFYAVMCSEYLNRKILSSLSF